jgi:hypothetical protein
MVARQDRALGLSGRQQRQLKIRRTASTEPMSGCGLRIAEDLLAELVARAFAADHPELFAPTQISQKGGDAPAPGREGAPTDTQGPR